MTQPVQTMYSCVVDATPALYYQTMVWAWTATRLAGIDPSQLVVHVTDGCDDRLRRELTGMGVRCVPVPRFPAGTRMCNKLAQLESPALRGQPRVVLTDCDIAWLAPIDAQMFGAQPRAKVVDFANPPFELLEPLLREAGFPRAERSATSIGGETTFHNNCNGGMYLLSGAWLERLREPWPRWVAWVEARAASLGPFGAHLFQVAFLLAMEEQRARVEHLPIEYNFPTHTDRTAGCPIAGEIRALHFHEAYDASGLLLPAGVSRADDAVAAVNACLEPHLAGAWWVDRRDLVVQASVHGRFWTRRDDHVTRQLETYGAHTRNELAMVLAFLRPGDRVIDVGAHIGTLAVPFAQAVGPAGRVIAIEPDVESFDLLIRNLTLNGVLGHVRAECVVVTDEAGPYHPVRTANHTSATYYRRADTGGSSTCAPLDSLASEFDPARPLRLIKIDAEGMELSILRSAEALIAAYRPLLYIEVSPEQLQRAGSAVREVDAFLTDRGYALFRHVGSRNSTNDRYEIAPMATLAEGGAFFDCLAVPRERVGEEPALDGVPGRSGESAAGRATVAPDARPVPTAVCVLGMHRSGTSLVARTLNLLGVALGSDADLARAAPDNPRGFWEHPSIRRVNDEILEALAGSWHEPPVFPEGWERTAAFQDLRTRARRVIARDFGEAPLWGWKDPRTCVTLPFWQQVIGPMRYVICLRNPLDVARSLEQRDGFSQEKGVGLWVAYMRAALRGSTGAHRLFVSFDDVIEQPAIELARMAAFLSREPAPASASMGAAAACGDPALRHHHADAAGLAGDPAVSVAAKSLYVSLRLLVRMQHGQHDADDDVLSAIASVTGHALQLDAAAACADQLRRALEAETADLAESRRTGRQLEEEIAAAAVYLRTIEAERDRADARVSALETPAGVAKLALRALLPRRAYARLRRLVTTQ